MPGACLSALPVELILQIVNNVLDVYAPQQSQLKLLKLSSINRRFNAILIPRFLETQPAWVSSNASLTMGAYKGNEVVLDFSLDNGQRAPCTVPHERRESASILRKRPDALSGLARHFSLTTITKLHLRFRQNIWRPTVLTSYIQDLPRILGRLDKVEEFRIILDGDDRCRSRRYVDGPWGEDAQNTLRNWALVDRYVAIERTLAVVMDGLLQMLLLRGCRDVQLLNSSGLIRDWERRDMWESLLSNVTSENPLLSTVAQERVVQPQQQPKRGVGGIVQKTRAKLDRMLQPRPTDKRSNSPPPLPPKDPASPPRVPHRTPPKRNSSVSSQVTTITIQCPFLLHGLYARTTHRFVSDSLATLTTLKLSHLELPPADWEAFFPLFRHDNVLEGLEVEWCTGISVSIFLLLLASCGGLNRLSFDRCLPFTGSTAEDAWQHLNSRTTIFDQLQSLRCPIDWALLFFGDRSSGTCMPGVNELGSWVKIDAPSRPFDLHQAKHDDTTLRLPNLASLTILARTATSPYFTYRSCSAPIDALLHILRQRAPQLDTELDSTCNAHDFQHSPISPISIHQIIPAPQTSAITQKQSIGINLTLDIVYDPNATQVLEHDCAILSFVTANKPSPTRQNVKKQWPGNGKVAATVSNGDRRPQNSSLPSVPSNYSTMPASNVPRPRLYATNPSPSISTVQPAPPRTPTPTPTEHWVDINRLVLSNRPPPVDQFQAGSLARWVLALFPGVRGVEMMAPPYSTQSLHLELGGDPLETTVPVGMVPPPARKRGTDWERVKLGVKLVEKALESVVVGSVAMNGLGGARVDPLYGDFGNKDSLTAGNDLDIRTLCRWDTIWVLDREFWMEVRPSM